MTLTQDDIDAIAEAAAAITMTVDWIRAIQVQG